MRQPSAASSKTKGQGSGQQLRREPKAGTRLREIYDLFYDNKGIPVNFSTSAAYSRNANGAALENLQNFYGLDIRRLKKNTYVLAGEWFDTEYVDYIAQRIEGREPEERARSSKQAEPAEAEMRVQSPSRPPTTVAEAPPTVYCPACGEYHEVHRSYPEPRPLNPPQGRS